MQPFSKATPKERQQYLVSRREEFQRIRRPREKMYKDISRYISPFSGRFNVKDHQEDRNFDLIVDDEASRALNILVSGLARGVTSPASPWFKVHVQGAESDMSIKRWCADVERILLYVFQHSNTYNSLHTLYRELCLFGSGVDIIHDDESRILRHHVLTCGEYYLQTNNKGDVDTVYRDFQLTTSQAVQEFGYQNLPKSIQKSYDANKLDEWHSFCHAIEPRDIRNLQSMSNKDMPWASYYFAIDEGTEIIKESGYEFFPALCPRWDVLAGETYGISPAMIALPTVKQLQLETDVCSRALELISNPPIQAPMSARQDPISLTPGSVNFTSGSNEEMRILPILNAVGDINPLVNHLMQLKSDIKSDFFVDLFLMVQSSMNDRKTATEIYALQEEKLLVLGSVMERLQHELLAPLVMLTFKKLVLRGEIPQPPQQLDLGAIDLEFQSMLAQSQRSVGINNIDRMISAMQALASTCPEVIDRIDSDGLIDVYADRLSVDPRILRSADDAAQIRQQREQAIAQQQQAQQQADMTEQYAMASNQMMQAQKAGADASLATQQLSGVGL